MELVDKMQVDKIVSEIQRYFDRDHKYVFWYDKDAQFKEQMEDPSSQLRQELPEEVKIMDPKGQFKLKYELLQNQDSDKAFLLYAPYERPKIKADFLSDMERYSPVFSADSNAILLAELKERIQGFNKVNINFVRQHNIFFRANKRKEVYISYYQNGYSDNYPEIGIIASFFNKNEMPVFDENDALIRIIEEGLDSDNPYLEQFAKYNVLDTFIEIYQKYFGFQKSFDLLNLFRSIIVTAVYNQLEEPIPNPLKEYSLSNWSNVLVFINRFKDSAHFSELFSELAHQVWVDLDLEEALGQESLKALQKITVLDDVNEIILSAYRSYFQADGTLATSLDTKSNLDALTKNRVNVANYGDQYKFLSNAMTIWLAEKEFGDDWQHMLDNYVNYGYKLDTAYRNLVSVYNSFLPELRNQYQVIKNTSDTIYNDRLLDNLAAEWNSSFKLKDVPTNLRQERFYKNYLEGVRERVVVIISDAFRYEVAVELMKKLNRDDRINAKMNHAITALPSVTYMGMPLLLPHKTLAWDGKKVLVDGKDANSTLSRDKILKSYDENNVAYQYSDGDNGLANKTSTQLKDLIVNKHLIYVYHNVIDNAGHGRGKLGELHTFRAVKQAIDEIYNLIQSLRTINVSRVIVTADHGFIYRDLKIEDQSKIEINSDGGKNARYFMTNDDLETSDMIGVDSVMLRDSLNDNDDINVYYPKTTNIFKTGGATKYYHGGSSLQEMVIPVLDMKMSSKRSKAKKATIKLANTAFSIMSLEMNLVFNQEHAISDLVLPTDYLIYMSDESDRVISNFVTIKADRSEKDITKAYRVTLNLQKREYDRNQSYYLNIDDKDSQETIDRIRYTMDLIV